MRTRLALLAGLGLSLSLVAAPVPVEEAARAAEQELRQASTELSTLRETIARERIPLDTRLRELESATAGKRAEVARIRQAASLDRDRQERLRAEARDLESEARGAIALLLEYRRDVETRLTGAEAAALADSLRAWETGLASPDRTTRAAAAAALLDNAMRRVEANLAPRAMEGVCADAEGREVPGTFGQWGPVTLFVPRDPTRVPGWVTQDAGGALPRLLPATDPKTIAVLRALAAPGEASPVPVDISGGTALRVEQARETLWQHLVAGGAIMVPIGVVAVVALLQILLKTLSLARMRAWDDARIAEVTTRIRARDLAAAGAAAGAAAAPLRAVLRGAVDHPDADRERLEEILHERILGEVPGLEKHLAGIAVLAGVAPLLGLLGTVTGMIHTFKMIMLAGAGDPRLLSGGISEALITTEAGLVVAIPALLAHAALARRVRALVGHLERAAVAVANRLHGPGGATP